MHFASAINAVVQLSCTIYVMHVYGEHKHALVSYMVLKFIILFCDSISLYYYYFHHRCLYSAFTFIFPIMIFHPFQCLWEKYVHMGNMYSFSSCWVHVYLLHLWCAIGKLLELVLMFSCLIASSKHT